MLIPRSWPDILSREATLSPSVNSPILTWSVSRSWLLSFSLLLIPKRSWVAQLLLLRSLLSVPSSLPISADQLTRWVILAAVRCLRAWRSAMRRAVLARTTPRPAVPTTSMASEEWPAASETSSLVALRNTLRINEGINLWTCKLSSPRRLWDSRS